MYKKTLLSLAVASSLALTGCFESGSDNKSAGSGSPATDSSASPIFNPVSGEVPIPNDLLLAGNIQTDGSFDIDEDDPNPVEAALDSLSGGSTVAPHDIQIRGEIDPDTVLGPVEANQQGAAPTVLVFKLGYESGTAISNFANLPSGDDPLTPVEDIQVTVETFEKANGQDAQFIRISPTTPLEPGERYSVVITRGIQQSEATGGGPISKSRTLERLLSGETIEGELGGAQGLAQLWTGIASAAPGIDSEDVALAYNFTTSPDREVLSFITNPVGWMNGQLQSQGHDPIDEADEEDFLEDNDFPVPESRKESLAFSNAIDFFGDTLPVTGENPLQISAATVLAGFNPDTPPNALAHQGQINLPYYLGTPTSEDGTPIVEKSWQPDQGLAAGLVGYARTEFEADDFAIAQADPEVSEVLNYRFPFPKETGSFDVPLMVITPAQNGDDDFSDPAGKGDLGESLSNLEESYDVAIFQHGITTDRSAALAYGSSLVENYDGDQDGLIVFAIDQPLHGIGPAEREGQEELTRDLISAVDDDFDEGEDVPSELVDAVINGNFPAFALSEIAEVCPDAEFGESAGRNFEDAAKNVLADYPLGAGTADCGSEASDELEIAFVLDRTVRNQGSTIPGLAAVNQDSGANSEEINERHFGYGSSPLGDVTEMKFDPTDPVGASGDNFINLSNFLASRDNLRQGVMDLLNLRKTIADLGLGGNVYMVGHSLGAMNGGVFSAVSNRAFQTLQDPEYAVAGTHLLTPASGVTRLLENSPSFAPQILQGLANQEDEEDRLFQNQANYQSFLNVFQHAIDSADPVNFALELNQQNVLIGQVDGDLTTPNAAIEENRALVQANPELEGNSPLDVETSIILMDGTPLGRISSSESPLAGSEQLNRIIGSEITRYTAGAHGTPVLPREEKVEEGDIYRDATGNWIEATEDDEFTIVTDVEAFGTFNQMFMETLDLIE